MTRARRIAMAALSAANIVSCGRDRLDRIPVPDPPLDQVTLVRLSPLPLQSDEDYRRLDEWLGAQEGTKGESVEDTIRFYDALTRLALDNVEAQVRAALVVLALDEERGRVVARGVLDRFKDLVPTDPRLQALSAMVAAP